MSVFIADACALIAFHSPMQHGMSRAGQDAMRDGEVYVSGLTVWEIERKVAAGRLPRPVPPGYRGDLTNFLREYGYVPLPLSWTDGATAARLPDHHRDPMDRFLIAAALRMDLTIVTSDEVFRDYGVRTIW